MHYSARFCIKKIRRHVPFSTMTDTEQMVERCKRGDTEALSTLYTTYYELMFRTCLGIVHDKDVAEDIVHDGYILIFTSINQLNEADKLKSWMNRIMVNLSLKYLKSKKDTQPVDDIATALCQKETSFDIIPPFEELMTMIEHLPEGYRNVFKLSVLDGLSHAEIAKELGIAVPTVSSQFYRARKQLSKMVSDYRIKMLLFMVLISMIFLPIAYLIFHEPQKQEIAEKFLPAKKQKKPFNSKEKDKNNFCRPVHRRGVVANSNFKDAITSKNKRGEADSSITILSIKEPQKELTAQRQADADTIMPIMPQSLGVVVPDKNSIAMPLLTKVEKNGRWRFGLDGALSENGNSLLNSILQMITVGPESTDDPSAPKPKIVITDFKTWENLNQFIQAGENKPVDNFKEQWNALLKISSNNFGDIITHKHFGRPLTLGLNFSNDIGKHWSIGSGIRFTSLTTALQTGNNNSYNITENQKTWFVGIPLNLNYTLLNSNRWRIYSTIGGGLDIPFYAHFNRYYVVDGNRILPEAGSLSKPNWQWSFDGGIGIGYELMPHMELFFSPKATYYIPNNSTIPILWQDKPWRMTWPFGIRLKF
jgi:RNA polymerase sigma factor (sigma-70 family)